MVKLKSLRRYIFNRKLIKKGDIFTADEKYVDFLIKSQNAVLVNDAEVDNKQNKKVNNKKSDKVDDKQSDKVDTDVKEEKVDTEEVDNKKSAKDKFTKSKKKTVKKDVPVNKNKKNK